MGKSGELLKNTAIISIGKMGTQVVNFLLLPLYTAKLTTEAYGNFDYVTTIASFLVPLMTMLMEESMFRFLIDSKTDKEKETIISHTFLFCFVSGFVTSLIIGIASWIFNYSLGYAILIIVYLLCLLHYQMLWQEELDILDYIQCRISLLALQ